MIDHQTLVALACMIANKGAVDTSSLEKQLSSNDKAQVQLIMDSGACLPEKMENLVTDTQKKIDNKEVIEPEHTSPTGECA